MEHPLEQRIRQIGRGARRLVWTFAIARSVAIVLAAILVLTLLDGVLRIRDPGLRWLESIGVLLALAAACWWWLIPACNRYRQPLEVARRIEFRYPELGNRLSNAVAFLHSPVDATSGGSSQLRQEVIRTGATELERLDVRHLFDTRSIRSSLALAVGVVAVAALAAGWAGESASLALQRLAMPWSDLDWPKRNELAFLKAPQQLSVGDDFEVELIDRNGQLPDHVELQWRVKGDSDLRREPMKLHDNKMVLRLPNILERFSYRAVGGDDYDMPWIDLRLVETPSVARLEVTVEPPDYSRLPSQQSDGPIRALVGSKVHLQGQATKPIMAAWLKTDTHQQTTSIELSVDPDQRTFFLPADRSPAWVLQRSGTYAIELQAGNGLSSQGEQNWSIEAVADQPPTVQLDQPVGPSFVTADAAVPIVGRVQDDLAIRSVVIRYLRSDQTDRGEQSLVIVQHQQPVALPDAPVLAGQTEDFAFDWNLDAIPGLVPGIWIDFHVAAEDFKPQQGQSTGRRLTIISVDQFEDRLAARQAAILNQLNEALRVQRECRSQTRSLEIQIQETNRLQDRDVDQLQSAELLQRDVTMLLSDGSRGAVPQIESLLSDLQSNRVDRPEITRRMQQLLDSLRQLDSGPLPDIQRDLLDALKSARNIRAARVDPSINIEAEQSRIAESLETGGKNQDLVIETLERLLGELSQWDSYRQFSRDVSRLRRDQETLRDETEQIRRSTLTKNWQDLDAQQQADLKRLAERQLDLARRFEAMQSRMRQMQGPLQASDPLASRTLQDALDTARRLELGGRMQESGQTIARNQVGQAVEQQQQVVDGLQQLADVLANRREHQLERVLQQLGEARQQLQDLTDQQARLRADFEAAQQSGRDPAELREQLNQLAEKQNQLAERTRQLQRQLQRLQAQRPAASLQQASQRQQQASQAAQQGDAAAASQAAVDSEQMMRDVQQQLEQQLDQLQQDLFHEQLARLEQMIDGLRIRQESLLDRTRELDDIRSNQGQLTRPQLVTVREMALEQHDLSLDTQDVASRLARSDVFSFALASIIREMQLAAANLERNEVGSPTQQPQQFALRQLEQLFQSVQQQAPLPQQGDDQQPPEGTPPGPEAEAMQAHLAELRLIKMMQEEIQQRTMLLEQIRQATGQWNQDQIRQFQQLSERQGQLAEMLQRLVPSATPQDSSDPISP